MSIEFINDGPRASFFFYRWRSKERGRAEGASFDVALLRELSVPRDERGAPLTWINIQPVVALFAEREKMMVGKTEIRAYDAEERESVKYKLNEIQGSKQYLRNIYNNNAQKIILMVCVLLTKPF